MAKTANFRVRMEPPEYDRVVARAKARHLSVATHIRQVLLEDCDRPPEPVERQSTPQNAKVKT